MVYAALLALALLCLPAHASEPVLVGQVDRIVDGDTVDVRLDSGVIRVRMHGIDTPERGQAFFREASDALSGLIAGKNVELSPVGQPSFDRMVARVYLGDMDVNAEMLRMGMAYAETRFLGQVEDGASYCAFENAARSLKRGIWGLPWEDRIAPWEHRRRNQSEFTDFADETTQDCIASIGSQRQ